MPAKEVPPLARADAAEAVADHILYLVVLPPAGAGEYSLFQGFSINTFSVLAALQHIFTLPPTITELFVNRDDAIRLRASGLGGYAVAMLDAEFLADFREGLPYTVLVSTSEMRDQVERHVHERGRRGWIHLTAGQPTEQIRAFSTFDRAEMFAWTRSVVEALARERGDDVAAMQWRPFANWPEWRLRLRRRAHRITEPTEAALVSLGATLGEATAPLVGNDDAEFARAISRAAMTLEGARSRALRNARRIPGTPTAIVTVPSVYRHLSANRLRRDATRGARIAFRNILRQRQYTAMRLEVEDAQAVHEDRFANAALMGRAHELAAYTAALSIAASSLAAPVLRCPPQVDRIRELLIRLAGIRGDSQGSVERRNQAARRIGTALRSSIPAEIVRHIERHQHEGIKLIGDTPLELLPLGDMPLGLAASTSRLPTLPGNLLMRQTLLRHHFCWVPKILAECSSCAPLKRTIRCVECSM